jgi:hypothetical protein
MKVQICEQGGSMRLYGAVFASSDDQRQFWMETYGANVLCVTVK